MENQFEEPRSLEEAKARDLLLSGAITDIQVQMSNRDRRDREGNRIGEIEFWQWRHRAGVALKFRLQEKRLLKDWISKHQRQRDALVAQLDAKDPSSVANAALRVIKALKIRGGNQLDEEETAIVNTLTNLRDGTLVG